MRDGKVLVVRRARKPALNLYTFPGGGVEIGETLSEAVTREVREETGLAVEPVALAGEREVIVRDAQGKVERHFVILCFAARWLAGEPVLNEELDDARWLDPADLGGFAHHRGPRRHRRRGDGAARRHRLKLRLRFKVNKAGFRYRLAVAPERAHM